MALLHVELWAQLLLSVIGPCLLFRERSRWTPQLIAVWPWVIACQMLYSQKISYEMATAHKRFIRKCFSGLHLQEGQEAQRQKFSSNAISKEASADPTGSSEDAMSLSSCPALGWGGQAFMMPCSSVNEWRLPMKKYSLWLSISLLKLYPKWGKSWGTVCWQHSQHLG